MPVFNAGPFLDVSIASILNQSFSVFELILVDDGSTDETSANLHRWAQADNRIRVLRNSVNLGVGASLNKGVLASNGTWIARMDADDIAEPHRFQVQRAYVLSRPNLVLLGSNVTLLNESGLVTEGLSLPQDHREIRRSLLFGGWPLVHPSTLFSRVAFDMAGGYIEARNFTLEDHAFFIRLSELGEVANHPDALLRYRRHHYSYSNNARIKSKQVEKIKKEMAWESLVRTHEVSSWMNGPSRIDLGLHGLQQTSIGRTGYLKRQYLYMAKRCLMHLEFRAALLNLRACRADRLSIQSSGASLSSFDPDFGTARPKDKEGKRQTSTG